MNDLRIAYLTVGRADDVHEWSGLNAAIRAALIEQGCVVQNVDQLGVSYPIHLRARKKLLAYFGSTYALERAPYAAEQRSRAASAKLAVLDGVDAIVTPSTMAVSNLDNALPVALWADATFHALRVTYPEYANYAPQSIDEGERLERAALGRATLLCYASRWAADDAVRYYGVPEHKVRVIEFGANAASPFTGEGEAAECATARGWNPVKLAFVGVDWQRKGGPLAVEIVSRLNAGGLPAVLTVIGCEVPPAVSVLPFVRPLGFLSKKHAADRARLHDVLRTSHLLLMPTLAECFGLVFAEAAAFAVPSISRDVGGVGSAIVHGRSGLLLAADAGADAYCAAIRDLVTEPPRYYAMCAEAYRDYRQRLNWRVAGSRFVRELRAVLSIQASLSR